MISDSSVRYSWNQPICEQDWLLRYPHRVPVRIKDAEEETCAYCGKVTDSGIYVREDPNEVRFPKIAE